MMEPPTKIKKTDPTQFDSEISQLSLDWPHDFQPTGISYIQKDLKTILIITGVNEILTFLLGDFKTVLNSTEKIEPLKKNVILIDSTVTKIIHSKLKTFCLHENGTLSYFMSHKQLKKVKRSARFLDIIKYKEGFAMLLKDSDNTLTIEYQPDNEKTPTKMIDCGPAVDTEQYSLTQIIVTEENATFLSQFLCVETNDLTKNDAILMFSVGNNLFWTQKSTNDECEIRSLRNFSSKVMKFWLIKASPVIFVAVLVSGVMEIVYFCPISGLIDQKRFYLFDDCWSLDMKKTCVFSDGRNLNFIELKQNLKKKIEIERRSVQLAGVIGFVEINQLNRILCVTENRCLYQVSVGKNKTETETSEFLQVDDELLIKAKSIQNQFRQLLHHYQESQKSIVQTKTRNDLLKNFHLKHPSSIFVKTSYLESFPQQLDSFKHFLADFKFNLDDIYLLMEINNKSEKTRNSFIILEFIESGKTRVIPIQKTDAQISKFLFVLEQNQDLHLPDIQIWMVHLIQRNHDVLMLKTQVRHEKETIEPKIVIADTANRNTNSKKLKNTIKQILATQNDSPFLLKKQVIQNVFSSQSISYRIKISDPNIVQAISKKINLSTTNSLSIVSILGRAAKIQLKQQDDKSFVISLVSSDIEVLKYLKKFIVKVEFDQIGEKRIGIGVDTKKSLEVFSSILYSNTIVFDTVLELYGKMRSLPIEYTIK